MLVRSSPSILKRNIADSFHTKNRIQIKAVAYLMNFFLVGNVARAENFFATLVRIKNDSINGILSNARSLTNKIHELKHIRKV